MTDLYFNLPSQILFGADSIARIGGFFLSPESRVFIVTEAVLHEKKTIAKLQNLLSQKQISHITFDEVIPNSTSASAEDGLALARAARVDTVIGMGGIRTLNTAKCIAMAYSERYGIDDFLSGAIPEKEPVTYIEIPTTCRNQLAFTNRCLIVDSRDRTGRILSTQPGITKLVVVDPNLSASLPLKYTQAAILDTLASSIEGYISSKANRFSDLFFEKSIQAIQSIAEHGIDKVDEPETRETASFAGLLCGIGLTSSAPGIATGLSFAIGSKCIVPKSAVGAILLPHVLEYNANAACDKLAVCARLLGEADDELPDSQAALQLQETVRRMIGIAGIPARLRELDLKLDDLLPASEAIFSYELAASLPRRPSTSELYDIVKAAY